MRKAFSVLHISISFFFLLPHQAFAGNATIGLYPQSGSFDKPFKVNMIIDGRGDKFNAAESTIKITDKIKIEDLTLGDCNFSFLHTPSIQNPSFSGVILSSHATKCTVYTMTIIPVSKGKASATLSQGAVRRYGDAVDILSSSQNGSYEIKGTYKTDSVLGADTKNVSKDGLYSLSLNVISEDKPVSAAIVTLNTVSKKEEKKASTNDKGAVHFSDVKPGIYSVIAEKDNNKLGETIINVNGVNHKLTLTLNLDTQKNNPLMMNKKGTVFGFSPLNIGLILIAGIVLGVGVTVIGMQKKQEKSVV